jgi:L-ascorbate metabolism protein UlaG (beta-lactamase superfamily)
MIDESIAKVIASGSTGNCELYFSSIAVDMGISYSKIKPYKMFIQLVLFSHEHSDHFNIKTIKKLAQERPTLRFGCGAWMLPLLDGIKNVDVYELNKWYDYGAFKVCIGKSYHDVDNCFFRIEKNGYKIFRATDSAHLENIEAKDYDLYAIEHNYDEDTVYQIIERQESQGKFAHQKRSINSHLSEQQARDFIFKNRKKTSEVIRLHESKTI